MMRVLVACEFSGRVRDAFLALGHDAMSCDLLPTDVHGPHYQGDVRDVLGARWDLMVAHPPCTHLAVSGARWFKDKQAEQVEALDFVRLLLAAPIHRIALENPVSIISSRIRKPDQVRWRNSGVGREITLPMRERAMEIRRGEVLFGPTDADLDADAGARLLHAATGVRGVHQPDAFGRTEGGLPRCATCGWAEKTEYQQHGYRVYKCQITGGGHTATHVCEDWEIAP